MINDTPSKRSLNTTLRAMSTTVNANIDLERLVLEKQFNEDRLMRELAYKDEALHLIQSEKNLKMDQYQLMVDEEMLRLKRKYELEIDNLNVRILELDRELRGSLGRETELEIKLNEVLGELELTTKELMKEKDTNKDLNSNVDKLRETIRLSDLENDRLTDKNHAMEEEILILLQIESDKTKEILLLDETLKSMNSKVLSLEVTIIDLEKTLAILNDNLRIKEAECLDLKYLADKMNTEIENKTLIVQKLTLELEELLRIDKIREAEIKDLMRENERLYN